MALTRLGGLPALFAGLAGLAGHALAVPTPGLAVPTPGLAVAAALLAATVAAGVLAAVLAPAARAARASAAGPLISRAAALREKSWCAAFLRQRDPDAPGRPRPRAPSAAPAAA
jgi:Family of unknown function (DUF6412)